jgi:hypothetical protein
MYCFTAADLYYHNYGDFVLNYIISALIEVQKYNVKHQQRYHRAELATIMNNSYGAKKTGVLVNL